MVGLIAGLALALALMALAGFIVNWRAIDYIRRELEQRPSPDPMPESDSRGPAQGEFVGFKRPARRVR